MDGGVEGEDSFDAGDWKEGLVGFLRIGIWGGPSERN